jgi:hypothetical protein
MLKSIAKAVATVMVATAALGTQPAIAAPPAILDSWASNISAAAGDVTAVVNPNGLNTTARMEYISALDHDFNLQAGRPAFYGALSSPPTGVGLGAGTSPVEFIRPLSGLAPSTKYVYRATAFSADGTTYGEVRGFTTTPRGGTTFALPDGRAWEMVSPVDKNGGGVQSPGAVLGGGVFQAAVGGGAVTYSSTSSFAGGAGAPGASQYVSTRGAGGWTTRNVTRPSVGGGYGESPDGVPFQLFDPSLSRALAATPWDCAQPQCRRAVELLSVGSGAASESPARPDLRVVGASEDLGVTLLSTCAKLTANATETTIPDGCDPGASNLYSWNGSGLQLVNLLPGASTGTTGASVAAPGAGAVSADGTAVYFELGGNLYLRRAGETHQVDAALGGGATFEVASADGSVAYVSKAGHLYRYAAGGSLTDLTPAGGVVGVLGVSPGGAHVYYLDGGGLQVRSGATTTKVADGADASNYPPATGTARVAADGTLAYLDSTAWPGSDNGGYSQVILYRPSVGAAICVSCSPTGARSIGPSRLPGEMANGTGPSASTGYKSRAFVAGGARLFFESADPLVLGDTNNAPDVYQWEAAGTGSCATAGGCVALVSSGRSASGARFLDASANGNEVFFTTERSLITSDPDSADVYVARVGGGFPIPDQPIPCVGDACQPVPSAPLDPVLATTVPRSEVNPPLRITREPAPRPRKPNKRKNGKKKSGKHKRKKGRGAKRATKSRGAAGKSRAPKRGAGR